jgi:hypothetical protein
LKSAAGAALCIAETIIIHLYPLCELSILVLIIVEQKFKSNQKKWAEFAQYTKDILTCVIQFLPDVQQSRGDLMQLSGKSPCS